MGKNLKRGVLVAFVFLFLIAPVLAFSGSGSGTSGDPYQITSWAQLQEMNDDKGASYILMNDLNSGTAGYSTYAGPSANGGEGWTPIGVYSGAPFTGNFTGQNYTIGDIFINRPSTNYQGFFQYTSSSLIIKDVTFSDVNITGLGYVAGLIARGSAEIRNVHLTGDITGVDRVGGFGGTLFANTYIYDSTVDVDIIGEDYLGGMIGQSSATLLDNCSSTGTVSGVQRVGGLTGSSGTSSTIQLSHSSSDVTGTSNYIGGLIGENDGPVYSSYATGNVVGGDATGVDGTGGFVGWNDDGTIYNSYATGNVTGTDYVGGFVGYFTADIYNSYSTGNVTGTVQVGGFSAVDTATAYNCFWDTETSSQASSSAGTGKTTSEMQDFTTFNTAGWSILAVTPGTTNGNVYWNIVDDTAYPFLSGSLNSMINLTSPENNYFSEDELEIDLSATVTDYSIIGIKNVSVLFDGVINQTNSSGTEGLYTFSIPGVSNGAHNWTIIAYDNDNNLFITDTRDLTRFSYTGSGNGSAEDPYQISTCSQLQEFIYDETASYLILTGNIDCSATSGWNGGAGFVPLGSSSNSFKSNFDGKGYTISDLVINRAEDYQSLFGIALGSTINNLTFSNADITGDGFSAVAVSALSTGSILNNTNIYDSEINSGGFYTGTLVGYAFNAQIYNCFSNSTINKPTVGNPFYYGGLVGLMNGASLDSSQFDGLINMSTTYARDIGGLVGLLGFDSNGANITNSFSTGDVDGDADTGGLVGAIGADNSFINNSYSSSTVSALTNRTGGLVGAVAYITTIQNSYAVGSVSGGENVGGLIGYNYTGLTVINSFWDNQTTGQTTSDGGTPKTTSQMKNLTTFTDAGWDIVAVALEEKNESYTWNIVDGQFYPFLSWAELSQPFITLNTPSQNQFLTTNEVDFTLSIVDVNSLGVQNVSLLINGVINETNSSGLEGDYTFTVNLSTGDYTWTVIAYDDSNNQYTADTRSFSTFYFTGGGNGSAENPYQITSWEELNSIRNNQNFAYYKLMNNLTSLSSGYDTYASNVANAGAGWQPIGGYPDTYSADFDGNDFTVIDLYIDRDTTDYVGLFGYLASDSNIHDLNLESVDITGDQAVGGLVGWNRGNVTHCSVQGDVNGNEDVGGIAGAHSSNLVSFSNTNVAIQCAIDAGESCGGLIGRASSDISNSYSEGSVDGYTQIGGLVGYALFNTINNSYSRASAYSHTDSNPYVGGLVGVIMDTDIYYSYSTGSVGYTSVYTGSVGGLIGDASISPDCIINSSFWDTQTSGQTTSDGGAGKTTTQMKSVVTFTDLDSVGLDIMWDFINNPNDDSSYNDYWAINSSINNGYPYLLLPQDVVVTLDSPSNGSASSSIQDFVCTGITSGGTNLTEITLYIWNSTNDIINQTTVNVSGVNNQTTFSSVTFSSTDTYHWNCLALNDEGYSNFATTNNTLQVDVTNPVINLESPADNGWSGYSATGATFSYTPLHASGTINNCSLYTNSTGEWALNQSNVSITEGETNYFNLVLPDGIYSWSVKCTVGEFDNFAYENRTVNVDVQFPQIGNVTFDSTPGTQTFSFDAPISDDNLNSCKYSIYTEGFLIDGLNQNVSFTCAEGASPTVTAYGTFTLRIYANDLASNENSTDTSFTISPAGTTGGGGGASGDNVERIPTIAIKKIDESGKYGDLDRAILFARINSLCEEVKTGETKTLTVTDYSSGECSLKKSNLETLRTKLSNEGLSIGVEDLVAYYYNFNDGELEQVYFSLEVIQENNLFTSVLGIVNPMIVNPPRLDRPFIITETGENTTIEYTFTVNKDIRECSVLEGENFECILLTNSSFKMVLHINNTDFFDKVFKGEISITSDADPQNLEVKRISLFPRVYNIYYPIAGIPALWILIFLGVVLLVLSIFWITRSRLRKELKRRFK